MKKINWTVRFNKSNKTFLCRFFAAVCLPVLVYFGLSAKDLTTWDQVTLIWVEFINNPYLIGLTVFNALNVLSDPTTPGLGDSARALTYHNPGKNK